MYAFTGTFECINYTTPAGKADWGKAKQFLLYEGCQLYFYCCVNSPADKTW